MPLGLLRASHQQSLRHLSSPRLPLVFHLPTSVLLGPFVNVQYGGDLVLNVSQLLDLKVSGPSPSHSL